MSVLESGGRIHRMENHDAAYHRWREAGVKGRILVHLDAHHDMWWIDDHQAITIANYICPALQEGLVREVYWVVPDASFQTRANRRAVAQNLKRIVKKYPGGRIVQRPRRATVMGTPLTICPLRDLPAFDEPVLLDIDVDYLILPRATYGGADPSPALPWCWPEQLLEGLRQRGVRSDLVTIAYSVEGGYTPLEWKYLGDELALRLEGGNANALTALLRLSEGARKEAAGDPAAAESLYRDSAAPWWRLAQFCARQQRAGDEGRKHYQRALQRDASYRTAYASGGIGLQWKGLWREAAAEYRRALLLDSGNAWAHLGLGQVAMAEKRWEEAAAHLSQAVALDGAQVDAHRARGRLLEKQGKPREAVEAYERSLKLALDGHRPLGESIVTDDGRRLLDDAHGRIHARLGRLYQQLNQTARAITAYRIAVASGYDRPWLRWRLVKLYLAQGRLREPPGHLWQALKLTPWAVRGTLRRLRRRAAKIISNIGRRVRRRA